MGEKLTPCLVCDGGDFLVINKPAGMLVHSDGLETENLKPETLTSWLLKNYPQVKSVGDNSKIRPGIVHRLDKDTSGLMIVCLSQDAFNYFKQQFQEHKIKKTYLALVNGIPKDRQGIIEKPLGLKSGTTKRTTYTKNTKMIKEAATKYKILRVIPSGAEGSFSLLEVQPLTGRTHQIRVHLASIGNPIVGDNLYGKKKRAAGISRLFLHSSGLEFTSPKGEKIKIESDMPENMENFMRRGLIESL